MKKSLQLLLVAFLFGGIMLTTSCKKEVTITYNMADKELCLLANVNTGPAITDSLVIQQADLQAAFSAASTTYTLDRISKVVAKGFKLKVSGSTLNLDGISGAQVYIRLQNSAAPGTMIASTTGDLGTGKTEIDFDIHGTDLKGMLGTEPLVVTLHVFNKANFTGACVTLTKGVIEFSASK